jgi:hypothetical protein
MVAAIDLHKHISTLVYACLLGLCAWCFQAGNIEATTTVYWRPQKALRDPSSFCERYWPPRIELIKQT